MKQIILGGIVCLILGSWKETRMESISTTLSKRNIRQIIYNILSDRCRQARMSIEAKIRP